MMMQPMMPMMQQMQSPTIMPGGLSADSYLDRRLRPLDAEHYSAAGLLPYRHSSSGSIEVLLPLERPWNSFTQAYDPLAWNIIGGKRIPRQEKSAETTAVRSFVEAVGQVSGTPEPDVLYSLMSQSYSVWYALGKFACLLVEVTDGMLSDFPERFDTWKKVGPHEEFRITPSGVKKYVKQIDAVEWVPAANLVPKAEKDTSDLFQNILQIDAFRQFLEGSLDLATAFPESASPPPQGGGWRPMGKGGKDGKKGGKDKGGKGKRGSYKGGKDGYKGGGKDFFKGFDAKNAMPPPYAAMGKGFAMPQPMMFGGCGGCGGMGGGCDGFEHQTKEMQRQMYGEQLHLLVQPLSPSPYLAQKITGMLLELPQSELMLNLTNNEELHKRVQEALAVLQEDGIVS